MPTIDALKLSVRDVFRVSNSRRGFGRKAVVIAKRLESETVSVDYRVVIDGGARIGESNGTTFLAHRLPIETMGEWEGRLSAGAKGRIINNDAPNGAEGEGQMATAAQKKKTAAAKRKAANAKKGSAAKTGGGSRATDAELDKLAAQVVDLRDNKGQAWADVCEKLDIQPSRARQLYNRGGGEPTRERKGTAKGKTGAAGKKGSAASKRRNKKKADPS